MIRAMPKRKRFFSIDVFPKDVDENCYCLRATSQMMQVSVSRKESKNLRLVNMVLTRNFMMPRARRTGGVGNSTKYIRAGRGTALNAPLIYSYT